MDMKITRRFLLQKNIITTGFVNFVAIVFLLPLATAVYATVGIITAIIAILTIPDNNNR